MNEENMKIYSIRLGREEIKRLDVLSNWHYYWKRSGIIRGIILAVFRVLPDIQLYDFIRFGYGASNVEVTITINRK